MLFKYSQKLMLEQLSIQYATLNARCRELAQREPDLTNYKEALELALEHASNWARFAVLQSEADCIERSVVGGDARLQA